MAQEPVDITQERPGASSVGRESRPDAEIGRCQEEGQFENHQAVTGGSEIGHTATIFTEARIRGAGCLDIMWVLAPIEQNRTEQHRKEQ